MDSTLTLTLLCPTGLFNDPARCGIPDTYHNTLGQWREKRHVGFELVAWPRPKEIRT